MHIIGLCPDSQSHLDLLGIITTQWNEFLTVLNQIKNYSNPYRNEL